MNYQDVLTNKKIDEEIAAQDERNERTEFSLAEIAKMDFPPIKFLLEPILTDMGGTVVFGGREKVGKSFCILLWMQELAQKGIKSYYYSAEDNYRRLADRNMKLDISPQEQELIICRAGKNKPIDRENFIVELENRFIDDPSLKVAWLDTMLLSLPEKTRKDYSEWSSDIRPWCLMAEKYERKIVMTHHCNKQGESPKDSLLGSVGIGASFEDRLIIQREGGTATLFTDGKDIDEKTYELEKLKYGWKIKNPIDPRYLTLGFREKEVLDMMKHSPLQSQMDLINKFAEKSIAITPAQMNDMIKKLWDGNFIDSDKGKVKGAKYFAI